MSKAVLVLVETVDDYLPMLEQAGYPSPQLRIRRRAGSARCTQGLAQHRAHTPRGWPIARSRARHGGLGASQPAGVLCR